MRLDMTIQFLGHSSFLITTSAGTRIVTDPFDPADYGGQFGYRRFGQPADIVTVSHEHRDHSRHEVVKGSPLVIKGGGKFAAGDAEFLGVATFHDQSNGAQKGRNTVFVISADELRVAHMGDLGHVLTADQAAEIGAVDVLLVPVGGNYTIDAAQADKVADQVGAKVVVPMHFRSEKCSFPITGVEAFTRGKANVTQQRGSTLEVTRSSLPADRQIVVLEPAL